MDSHKQEYEKSIVADFLKTAGECALEIETHDKPDVLVRMNTKRVGVEVTVYFSDGNATTGSPGQQLYNFWLKVQQQIEEMKNQSGQLNKVHAYVKLKKDELGRAKQNSLVKKLSRELFDFVLKASETATSDVILIPDWTERTFREFVGYPMIEAYVTEIRVRKGFFAFWDANVNASSIGINPHRMAAIIREKGQKAKAWDTKGLDELWLLVAAPHDTVFNAMHDIPERANLDNPAILTACDGTPFHRILFWSSAPHEWFLQIWPKATR